MMQKLISRSTFNKKYRYRLVLASDNIYLRNCGNCTNLSILKLIKKADNCFLMGGYGIPEEERNVNRCRGLCDLHQWVKP